MGIAFVVTPLLTLNNQQTMLEELGFNSQFEQPLEWRVRVPRILR